MTAAQLGVAGANVGFRDGTLIRTPDGKVWAISTEQRRWIANQSAFNQLGYQGGGIVDATTAEAAAHEVGADIGGRPIPTEHSSSPAARPCGWCAAASATR